jgi:hypothetical protein
MSQQRSISRVVNVPPAHLDSSVREANGVDQVQMGSLGPVGNWLERGWRQTWRRKEKIECRFLLHIQTFTPSAASSRGLQTTTEKAQLKAEGPS